MAADAPAPRGLAFRAWAGGGGVQRVLDVVCWRFLDGRPCQTAAERRTGAATTVVLIPVLPQGAGRQPKRSRSEPQPPPASHSASTLVSAAVEGSASAAGPTSFAAGGAVAAASPGAAASRDALIDACRRAQAALQAVGLRATLDDAPGQTPGAKYHAWDRAGVPLRVEVGSRELQNQTYALALHPRCAHLLPVALKAARSAASAETGDAPAGSGAEAPASTATMQAAGAGCGASARPRPRLLGQPLDALVAACLAVHAALASELQTGATAARGGWCQKLHLWPGLAPPTDTAAAVAAVLAALGGPPESHAASGEPSAGGSPHAGANAAGALPQLRPCVPHLLHLLHAARPCHCGRGHVSMQELQDEVAARFEEASGQAVAGWVVPAPPPRAPRADERGAPGRQQGQRKQKQGAARKAPRREGGAGAASGGGASEDVPHAPGSARGDADGGAGGAGGTHDNGNGGADASEEAEEEAGSDTGGSEHVTLLVGNIPPSARAGSVQAELAAAFAPYGCKSVSVPRTRSGGNHGYARVSLSGERAAAAAASAVAALDGGALRLSGAPLTVSFCAGRVDALFPHLPYAVRSGLRLDSVAAFSTTDMATADAMTHVLAALAARFVLPSRAQTPAPSAAAGARAEARGHPSEQQLQLQQGRSPALLPLVVTDGTACSGGNALSLARRFACVLATELDEERAEDLRHNAALVHAWRAFERRRQRLRAPREGLAADGPDAGASACAAAPPTAPTAPTVEPAPGPVPPQSPHVPCAASVTATPHAAEERMGVLQVLCADFTRLGGSLRQDVVFLDPPWGGPQYERGGTAAAAAQEGRTGSVAAAEHAQGGCEGGNAAGEPGGPARPTRHRGDTAFTLGGRPLADLVAALLGGTHGVTAAAEPTVAAAPGDGDGSSQEGGSSGDGGVSGSGRFARGTLMVALKLPSRAEADLRALQARVRDALQRPPPTAAVAPPAWEDARGGAAEGSGGSCAGACSCGPRLLCVEATLGRSALVVFLRARPQGGGVEKACSRQASGGGTGPVAGAAAGGARGAACGACARLGDEFRSLLREVCTELGVPYRVVCK